ncbi:sugar ABC transporter ATP-binding protein [Taklimakanibacter deserti]|uniref:sugar ABC transporter ATP-binding protein n=1 Tax=Taklimakanibacter deserti TaxID=2267839 RepID=UPI000E65196B
MSAPPADHPAALSARSLSKRYGETLALSHVDLTLEAKKVVGLVGENGAGKSTLLNILSGITSPDAGTLEIQGARQSLAGYGAAQRLGVGRVFQEQALIGTIPVFENLLLGAEARFTRLGQFMRRRDMIRLAQEMVDEAGAKIDVRRLTQSLSFSERQVVEIIRACIGPKSLHGVETPIIVLDEPTASLEKGDERLFFDLIDKVRQSSAVLFVSHRLTEILSICDEVVILKDGRRVASVTPAEADERDLHRLMVGRERDADYYHEEEQRDGDLGRPGFAARGLTRADVYDDVGFEVKAGEILGIGGLLDSGKSELGKGLAGIERPERGEIHLGDGRWTAPEITKAIPKGLGYVPAERLAEGMIASQPVAWNISSASGADLFSTRWGLWRHRREAAVSARFMDRLKIKARSPQTPAARLSGGNQQKVVLARWLARDLRALVLDNPTRGVDAGAKEEIYALLRALTAKDVAIVLITDDLLELIGLANRIAIMRQGTLSRIIDARADAKPTEQELVAMMLGAGDGDQTPERAA